ncbi:hypothetical protein K435DRAFT_658571, partial [Dendrothele bispora CBS 962.96]
MGLCHNPDTWLDKVHRLDPDSQQRTLAYTGLLRRLVESDCIGKATSTLIQSSSEVTSKAQRNANGEDDPSASEPLEGGPKTGEVAVEEARSTQLLSEVSISPDLTKIQRHRLEDVIIANSAAFGLDGRLGHYDEKVEITLKPNSQPVSLPPFPASPANREVIDNQMDSWLKLGVIEPSKSPWGAPAFIVHRNGK